ncbi:MAG: NAD(P)-dependent oxidoreductase, partial [Deinococcales bacterium]
MSRIVVAEFLPEAALALLRDAGEVVAGADLHARRADLLEQLADAEALLVRNQTRVDAELLAAAPRLRVIGRVGAGLDNFDLGALRERDIVLTCSPGANAASVAEYVLGAILTVYRRFGSVASQAAAGLWDREAATGREAYGKVLGIIGLGDIGARVAVRAKAFGMTLLATDPHLHPASFAVQEHGVTLVPLEALLERSDVVTLHPPLTPGTRHLIGPREVALMKRGALLINTGRGGLV